MAMRFRLPPGGDIPPVQAARRLAMSLAEFELKLPELIARGFPAADPTSGNYDLERIDKWRELRYPHLSSTVPSTGAQNANNVVAARIRGRTGTGG